MRLLAILLLLVIETATVTPNAHAASGGTVVAWGWNGFAQTNVPVGLNGVIAVAGGNSHSVGLRSDGLVVAWGRNIEGQTNVPAGLAGVTAIAAGYVHTVALKGDGTVVAWGDNAAGQTDVPVGLTGVAAIAAGYYHTVALKSDGTVVAWGKNSHGQTTGTPTLTTPQSATANPVTLNGQTLSGVIAIAAGDLHTLALKNDGTVVVWGGSQAPIPAGLTGITAIAAGGYHDIALKGDGTVVAWGRNNEGQTNAPTNLTGVTAIAAGERHSLALKSDGMVTGWGAGQMSTGNFPEYGQAIFSGSLSGVTAVAAGGFHTLAVFSGPPPVLTSQPQNLTVPVGADASFSVAATGAAPLSYQWFLNGEPVSGGTNATLLASVIQVSYAGIYTAVVSNSGGSVTSAPVTLTVTTTDTTPPWLVSAKLAGGVVSFAFSEPMSRGQSFSWTANGFVAQASFSNYRWSTDHRTLSFDAALPSETSIVFTLNPTGYAPAFRDLSDNYFPVDVNTVEVSNSPNIAPSAFGPATNLVLDAGGSTTLRFIPLGSSPLSLQWRLNGASIAGATNAALMLTSLNRSRAGSYTLGVSNAIGTANSATAIVRVRVPQWLGTPVRLGDGRFRLAFNDNDGGQLAAGDLLYLEVWATTNLANTNFWVRVTNGLSILNGQVQVDDADSVPLRHRFYRVNER